MRKKIAILASGEGSNFESLVEASRGGILEADVAGLITNRPGVPALARAARLGVPSKVFERKAYSDFAAWDEAVAQQLLAWGTQWVAMAGFLALIGPKTLRAFPNRMVNSHPSLLPKYGGKGLYGGKVHATVIAAGEKETGITVHLVDEVYDRGLILAQTRVPVLAEDTPETLAERVKAKEHSFYPLTLNQLIQGQISTR